MEGGLAMTSSTPRSPEGDTPESGELAQRFLTAQSWWIAAELVRRHPELTLRGDDHLSYLTIVDRTTAETRAVVNPTAVHVFRDGASTSMPGAPRAMASQRPRDFIRQVEDAARLSSPQHAPSSTPHTLAFRFVSTVLTAQVTDNHVWDCRNEVADSEGDPVFRGWLTKFRQAQQALNVEQLGSLKRDSAQLESWQLGVAERTFWALLRDDVAVALVSTHGQVYLPDRQLDLMAEYSRHGRQMLPVVVAALGDLLG